MDQQTGTESYLSTAAVLENDQHQSLRPVCWPQETAGQSGNKIKRNRLREREREREREIQKGQCFKQACFFPYLINVKFVALSSAAHTNSEGTFRSVTNEGFGGHRIVEANAGSRVVPLLTNGIRLPEVKK